ncbi:MAG TPA: ABC transporter ATP-binding protein [Streptosporangiaceae bacterium]|nr:ABC transporter ATP-binding protein [Streptosporangiaceae bacterium]
MTSAAATGGSAPLLEVERLRISFGGHVAVHDVGLRVRRSEVVGLVGESGSGKSLTCRAVLRIVPRGGRITAGAVRFDGRDVLGLNRRELRSLRAHDIGMIFQDPFSSLNPTLRIGRQLTETLRLNAGLSSSAARHRAIDLLAQVEIPDPAARLRAYPHELSGGQRQRVMIALALAADPKLLIADEPTTALDVSTQAQVLALARRLRQDRDMSMLLVSHDFGVIADMCDRVVVVYGGFVVETGTIEEVYTAPVHPYTRALLDAVPVLHPQPGERRRGIPGPPLGTVPYTGGCPFEPRCGFARPDCRSVDMSLQTVGATRASACPFVASATQEIARGGAA